MTPRGVILEATHSALATLSSQATVYTSFADVLRAEAPRSLVIGPGGEEGREAESHTGASVRRYPVRVVCTAWMRDEADALSFAVEAAIKMAADADRIGARLLPSNFGESSDKSERVYFSTVVNFEVLYECTT